MTHTEVNHTYSLGFTLRCSKPPSSSTSCHKSNKQTGQTNTELDSPTVCWFVSGCNVIHLSPTFTQLSLFRCRRFEDEEHQRQMDLIFLFHWPQSVLHHIMFSLVAWRDTMEIYDHYSSHFPSLILLEGTFFSFNKHAPHFLLLLRLWVCLHLSWPGNVQISHGLLSSSPSYSCNCSLLANILHSKCRWNRPSCGSPACCWWRRYVFILETVSRIKLQPIATPVFTATPVPDSENIHKRAWGSYSIMPIKGQWGECENNLEPIKKNMKCKVKGNFNFSGAWLFVFIPHIWNKTAGVFFNELLYWYQNNSWACISGSPKGIKWDSIYSINVSFHEKKIWQRCLHGSIMAPGA